MFGFLSKIFRRPDPMKLSQPEFGLWAETRAVSFLRKSGKKVIARNYRTQLGEIDIIAEDGDTILFVEVKASRSPFSHPEDKVNFAKQKRLIRAAKSFIARGNLYDKPARFDIITVKANRAGIEIDYSQDAFEGQ